jgi:hypothetical protein
MDGTGRRLGRPERGSSGPGVAITIVMAATMLTAVMANFLVRFFVRGFSLGIKRDSFKASGLSGAWEVERAVSGETRGPSRARWSLVSVWRGWAWVWEKLASGILNLFSRVGAWERSVFIRGEFCFI